jgi:hypothetical protein
LPKYRHYKLDGTGNFRGAEWLDASDDEDAVRQVRNLKLSCPSEIWDRKRLVARIEATSANA